MHEGMAYLQLDNLPTTPSELRNSKTAGERPPPFRAPAIQKDIPEHFVLSNQIHPSQEEGMDETIRIQRKTVEEHIRHENAKNWSGVFDTFVHDESAFYDVVPFNMRYSGLSGVKGFYEAANTAFPDFEIDVWGEYDAPGCSIREVTISGIHTGDWCGVPGTGRHLRFQLAGFFVFGTGEQEGKLLAERIYFDNDTVMRQIRGEMDQSAVADFPLPAAATLSSPR